MKKVAVFYIIGILLLFLAAAMTVPLGVAMSYGSSTEYGPFLLSIAITVAVGLGLFAFCRGKANPGNDLRAREGFAIVALGWLVISAFGALPFWLTEGGMPSFIDAYFETISGFSTTGASILTEPESLPRGLLFWRSFTHWFGGMGIVVLTVAILPFLGAGGYQLLRAEAPGPTADRLAPRIAETAKTLWILYLVLTVLEILLLLPVMGWFDASCHSFGTLATGGFSTRNNSIAAYDSVYVETVITLFMLIAGANFVLHANLIRGRGLLHATDSEFRFYVGLVVVATLVIASFLYFGDFPDQGANPAKYDGFGQCFRYSMFQVASIITTTGYGTADFDQWPNVCRVLLVLLMFVGGCSGSTGGGVKCIRVLVLLKYGIREVMHIVQPHAILRVRIGEHNVDKEVVGRVLGFFALWFVLFGFAVVAMTVILGSSGDLDTISAADAQVDQMRSLETAFTSVLATFGNIGPGLADVGPMQNFASIPPLGKVLLIFCMLLGRLEIYCVLILLLPSTWRA